MKHLIFAAAILALPACGVSPNTHATGPEPGSPDGLEVQNRSPEPARFYAERGQDIRFLGVLYPGESESLDLPLDVSEPGPEAVRLVAVPLGTSAQADARRVHAPDAVWSSPERGEDLTHLSFTLVSGQLVGAPRSR